MKVSYLITCSTETDSLAALIERVGSTIKNSNDELIILVDSVSVGETTKKLLTTFAVALSKEIVETKTCKILEHPLANNYGAHKNFGIEHCSGDFIFQLDGDELPPETLLGENLHALLESNPTIEAYAVPRINDFRGVTEAHAKQWGWRLTPSTSITHEKIIDTNSSEYKFLKENGYILEEEKIQ